MSSNLGLPTNSQIEAGTQAHQQAYSRAPTTKTAKLEEILNKYPQPVYWNAPSPEGLFGMLRWIIFNLMCIMSFGHPGLELVWACIRLEEEGDESAWVDGIRLMGERMNNMLVVASLLLATSAVLLTTVPPRALMLNYTLRGPYICMLGSFGLLVGSILGASACYLVIGKARPYWLEKVLFANRIHVYCMLIVLSYPFFSIGVAAFLLGFGFLSAIWCAEDHGLQGAATLFLIIPVFMAILFGVSCITVAAKTQTRKQITTRLHV